MPLPGTVPEPFWNRFGTVPNHFLTHFNATIMNITRSCAHCGQPLSGKANQVYCSNPCKRAAFKQKTPPAPPPDAPAPVVPPAGPARQVLSPPNAKGAKGATDAKDAKQTLLLQQKDHQHLERVKQMEHDEAERVRDHQLALAKQQRIEEQRELIDIILDLHRQHRQLTGQSTADLPLAARVRTVADARALAHLPMPAPVATLPLTLVGEAKKLFKGFTQQRDPDWAQSELTQAHVALTTLVDQVKQWQAAHPDAGPGDQGHGVYRLGAALREVVAAHQSSRSERFSIWNDPTIELQVPPALLSEVKRFLRS